jgi:hypothetical protein
MNSPFKVLVASLGTSGAPVRVAGTAGGDVEILVAARVSPDGWGLAVSVFGVLVPREADEC